MKWHIYENLHLVGIRPTGQLNAIIQECLEAQPNNKVIKIGNKHLKIGTFDLKLERTR